jgi:hypothetical protein
LKREHLELEAGKKNRNFLNNQSEVYLPENSPWIRSIDVVNFRSWLKKHNKDLGKIKRAKTINKKKKAANVKQKETI